MSMKKECENRFFFLLTAILNVGVDTFGLCDFLPLAKMFNVQIENRMKLPFGTEVLQQDAYILSSS